MKLYSYVVAHDTGFSPNPFFGYCTLACCKPVIRRTAKVGDWIVGLTSKSRGNRIVYFMRVDEVVESYTDYWTDPRFRSKRPTKADGVLGKCGDNIYEPLPSGNHRQLPSMHSNGEAEDQQNKAHDLSGKRILISETFAYFGTNASPPPPDLHSLVVARGHRCQFTEQVRLNFIRFTNSVSFGVHGAPAHWPEGDTSWMTGCGCKLRRMK